MKKNVNKFLKITLLLCMIFSQVAEPIKVLADETNQQVVEYNLAISLDNVNDKIVVQSNGTKVLNSSDNYVLKINRSFVYTDSSNSDETIQYLTVSGSELTTGKNIDHDTFSYNGTSYVNATVYEIDDQSIDFSTYTDTDYENLLDTDNVDNIMSTSFNENITYNNNSFIINITGDSVVCTEDCTVSLNGSNDIITIGYVLNTGDLNPNIDLSTYSAVYKINDKFVSFDSNFRLDVNKLIDGEYEIYVELRDATDKVVNSTSRKLTYMADTPVDGEAVISSLTFSPEAIIDYTMLSEEQKDNLGINFRYLEEPLAYIFDNSVSGVGFMTNYNFYDNDTKYSVVFGNNLMGAFDSNSQAFKASDIISKLDSLNLRYVSYKIVDANGNQVDDNTFIQNGMKLNVTYLDNEYVYDFLVSADVDGNYVENSDLEELINKILNNDISFYDILNLDFNSDSTLDVKDASILGYYLFNKDYTAPSVSASDTIVANAIISTNSTRVGDSFDVTLTFDGFSKDYFNAILGSVNYDSSLIRLDSITVLNDNFVGNNKDNMFMYASSETFSSNDTSIVKITFTALSEGTPSISFNNITLVADGTELNCSDSNAVSITIERALYTDNSLSSLTSSYGQFDKTFNADTLEYTLYVDSYISEITLNGVVNNEYATVSGLGSYSLTSDSKTISITVTAENGATRTYTVNVVKVYKSSNNNLNSILIDGEVIEGFDPNVLEYTVNVGSDVDSLDISAIVADNGAWAKIEGNENFVTGENIVTIKVYAEDGTTKTYTIKVIKEAKDNIKPVSSNTINEDNEKGLSAQKVIIIILIVLVVAGLLYLIFAKDVEDIPKVEEIKPKKEKTKK